jgi:hypothetical protein
MIGCNKKLRSQTSMTRGIDSLSRRNSNQILVIEPELMQELHEWAQG